MAIKVRTWSQSEWRRPGRLHHYTEGDFHDLSGLYPDYTRRKIKRGPAWSTHVPWPEEAGVFEGFVDANVLILDPTNNIFCFYGKLTNGHLATVHWSRDSKSLVDKYDLTTALGSSKAGSGYHGRTSLYVGGKLYLISAGYDIHYGANLATQPPTVEAGTFGTLAVYGDKIFAADRTQGIIYRLNAAGTSFEAYYTPRTYLRILDIIPFHQYLAVIAKTSDGRLGVYRIPDIYIQTAHEIGSIPASTSRYASGTIYSAGRPFAHVGERIYMLSGYLNPIEEPLLNLYEFDGTHLRKIAEITDIPTYADTQSLGLLAWHGELVLYALDDTGTDHYVKLLVGDRFVDFAPLSATLASLSAVYSAGGDLVVTCEDGSDNEGFKYTYGRQDGWISTCRLDMGQPGRLKTLHHIAAELDAKAEDFFIKLWYKIDDADNWTQAGTTQENTYRPAAQDLDLEFYLLQIKVELDDDTGNDEDFAIERVTITYSADLE
jgi:hypothetical protein